MLKRSKVAFVHIPRTGGTALGSHLYHQTKFDPTFFFSCFGLDSSQGANRVVIERVRKGDADHRRLTASAHLRASAIVFGHFSADIVNVLDDYELQLAAVVREPVARTISLIHKYASDMPGRYQFGSLPVPSKSGDAAGFWAEILRIFRAFEGEPIPGLAPHENLMLQDGMCHMIAGTPLHTYVPPPSLEQVFANLPRFKLGLFERFNETVGALMRALDLPIVLDPATNYAGEENPVDRAGHAPLYGAPPAMVEMARALNQRDEQLYRHVLEQRLYLT